MRCPNCSEAMERGFLQSGGSMMVWVKKKHYLSLHPKEGEVLLDKNYLAGAALPAWICKSCRRVIAEYSETEETEF